MIRVLLADDSALVRGVLKDIFSAASDIAVVGEARNGKEAVELTGSLKPDLVITDIMMPVMEGLEAIEEIMASFPTPILVLSGSLDDREVNLAFAAIKKGALDVMEKPEALGNGNFMAFGERLAEKVRILARVKVIRRRRKAPPEEKAGLPLAFGERSILAIGASTGGPKAVLGILKSLPDNFPGTVFIVQHIASGFARGFVQWLDRESRIKVRLAGDGDDFRPGEALVAPNDCHMVLEQGRVRLLEGAPVNSCRPSIDVLFKSLAGEGGKQVVALLLTGMGRDGADGLRKIRESGGITIVQDEESSVVFGMPKAAISLGAADQVLPLSSIPEAIAKIFSTT